MGSINKVIFGSDTLIDLTEDTVSPETLGKGVTAHDKSGVPIVGTMVINNYYVWSDVPPDTIGNDGDLYLKIAEA